MCTGCKLRWSTTSTSPRLTTWTCHCSPSSIQANTVTRWPFNSARDSRPYNVAWWPTKKLMICTNTYIHTQASKRESKTLTHQIIVTTLSNKYADLDRDTYAKETRDLEETRRVGVTVHAAPTKKKKAHGFFKKKEMHSLASLLDTCQIVLLLDVLILGVL